MSMLTVSISDMGFSRDPGDVLVTYSLGSCVGVTAYDPKLHMGAMVHCLLPSAAGAGEKARLKPFMFVNTGVAMMVRFLIRKGAGRHRLIFKAAGGANMRKDDLFGTGAQNLAALNRLLDRNRITLAAQAVGGTIPRSMFLHLDTGRVFIKTRGVASEL